MRLNKNCSSPKVKIDSGNKSCRAPRGGTPTVKTPTYTLTVTNASDTNDEDPNKPIDIPIK